MALTCPQCGAQNPDGNSFCMSCGTVLTPVAQVAPVGPPPDIPPPMVGPPPNLPPPGLSPYYAPNPAYPQAPVHRLPWVLIMGAVVALVVVMAGAGTAIAIFANRNGNQTGAAVDLPSPSPAGTPSPVQQSSPIPVGATTASTSAVTVTVPTGWAASTSDPDITVTNPAGDGSIVLSSGADNPPLNAQQIKDSIDKSLTAQFPDTKVCPNTKTTNGTVGGVSGLWWQLCFTVTQGGQSFPGEMTLFAGANPTGSVGYGIIMFTSASRMAAFFNDAKPILASVQWKLK
jgi:hypothetical protein